MRNKFLSISSVMVLTLLMFFINILFVLHDVSLKIIDTVNSKLTISLYLDAKYDRNSIEVTDLMNDLRDLGWWIQVNYKTKEILLDELEQKEPQLVQILERTNPLPNTIILAWIDLSQYKQVNNLIENKLFILSQNQSDQEHFSNYTSQYQKIESIIWVLDILQAWLYIIIGIFLISIFIIIYSVIGNFIYYFKDEIYITRLVGGSKKFIYGPFVMQGAMYSFFGFLLSLIVFLFVLRSVNAAFGELYFFSFESRLLLWEILIFTLVGGLSGLFSSRKYLN